jgi:hypothetical protein
MRLLATVVAMTWMSWGADAVHAEITLTTPGGLAAGDSFRFVFVTDGTIQGTSPDISTYNTFVNNQAGGATYNGITITWSAIGSTDSVDAYTNTDSVHSSPVYLADGTLVATSTTTLAGGLWGTSISGTPSLLASINQDLSGTTINSIIWTGTTTSGTGAPFQVFGDGQPIAGFSPVTGGQWVYEQGLPSYIAEPMYAMSEVLTVPSSVPEPSTLVLASAMVVGLVVGRARSRLEMIF